MVRPLGLPVGSVRALLLLGLATRAVLDLRRDHALAPWLVVALLISAASYFASRAAGPTEGQRGERPPLWLPTGTIRVIFLVLAGYGAWLWFRFRDETVGAAPVAWVLAGYVVGLVVRVAVRARRSAEEAGATFFEHILALASLVCVGGLVWLGIHPPPDLATWVEPLLGAIVVHYFATR